MIEMVLTAGVVAVVCYFFVPHYAQKQLGDAAIPVSVGLVGACMVVFGLGYAYGFLPGRKSTRWFSWLALHEDDGGDWPAFGSRRLLLPIFGSRWSEMTRERDAMMERSTMKVIQSSARATLGILVGDMCDALSAPITPRHFEYA